MLNDTARQKLLEKIVNSQEFISSSIYGNFLTYLVNSSLEGKNLKETTIAIDVFGKDESFNPAEDTIVRSHTYTLRKKLERYYFTEGKHDKYRVKIPKGHYQVKFVEATDNLYSATYILGWLKKHFYIFIILTLLVIIAIQYFQNLSIHDKLEKYHIINQDDPIWKEYLNSKMPILLITGNHFFFNIYDEKYNRQWGIRDPFINSDEDLELFKTKYPDTSIQVSPEPYFPYHSIWTLPPILSILYSANQKPILRKASSISPQILDEYNIIYVGSIKTMYDLKHTLSKSHFNFEIAPHKIIYTPPDSTSSQIFKTNLHSSGPNDDLVLALKLPGPSDNSIFIISSYHSLGAPEITNYLISTNKRKELEKIFMDKYQKIPDYFEVLFRVIGIDKTAYETKILICNAIEKTP
ncbi:MAG: hypothetical protein P8Y99_16355 [Calditrichaceae bacterium]